MSATTPAERTAAAPAPPAGDDGRPAPHGAWRRIARHAIRRRRLSPLTWGLPLGALALMTIAVFPSFEGTASFQELIESYPQALKDAFGITDESFSTVQGYLGAELFNLIGPLTTSFFVIHALASAICGAEQRGRLDTWLAAPLRRRTLLAGQLAGTAVTLAAILLVLAVVMQLSALAFGVDLPPGDTLAAVANLLPISLFFAGATLLLAGVSSRQGAVTGIAAGLLVLMYFVEVLGNVSDTVGAVGWLSAFHHYGSAIEDGIDPLQFAGLLAAGLLLAVAGAVLFERRDVQG